MQEVQTSKTKKECATCANWNPRESMGDARGVGAMAQQQMAICDRGPKWKFFPPQSTCDKHEAAPEPIVQRRMQWLAKSARPLTLEPK